MKWTVRLEVECSCGKKSDYDLLTMEIVDESDKDYSVPIDAPSRCGNS